MYLFIDFFVVIGSNYTCLKFQQLLFGEKTWIEDWEPNFLYQYLYFMRKLSNWDVGYEHEGICKNSLGTMIWKNRQLVTNEPVEFEK